MNIIFFHLLCKMFFRWMLWGRAGRMYPAGAPEVVPHRAKLFHII